MQLKDRGRLDLLKLLPVQQAEIQSGICFFFLLSEQLSSEGCNYQNQYVCFILLSVFFVFNASNGKLKLSSTKIYTGLHVTRIGPKHALKCIKSVYIHICVQYSKLTCNDSLTNWKIISKLFLLNYPCLSRRFNTFYFPFI